MATNPIGDNKTKTVSLEPELYEKTLPFWGRGKKFKSFSAYVRHLVMEDLKSAAAAETRGPHIKPGTRYDLKGDAPGSEQWNERS